ncbi:hypothetical protein F5Y16DRAFT_361154 [Xylariaceae sp. FL0255]|nr:hypothetical protein F5Y16DRAFT_361154 [Xylariaceae sp. FL0255]
MPWWSLWSQSPTQGTSPSSDAISSTSAASTTRTAPPKANIPSPISRPVSQTARIQKSLPTEEPRDDLINSSDIWEIGAKSLQTGAIAGSIGAFVGGGAGIMRSAPPVLFAAFAGFQWFSLGFSYRASKSIISHAWGGEENFSDSDRVKASGVGGAVAGMVGGMIRKSSIVL